MSGSLNYSSQALTDKSVIIRDNYLIPFITRIQTRGMVRFRVPSGAGQRCDSQASSEIPCSLLYTHETETAAVLRFGRYAETVVFDLNGHLARAIADFIATECAFECLAQLVNGS